MTPDSSNEHVVVVGAGIVGIACAHYLSKAGSRVSVIDQGALADACSHANCGYICPSHVLPLTEPDAIATAIRSLFKRNAPFRVRPTLRPAMWNWMWQFARRCNHRQMLAAAGHLHSILKSSMHEYRQLMEEESLACEWTENGLLYVLQSEHGMRQFSETDSLLREHFGIAAQRIEGPDLPAFDHALKPGLAGAFHYPGDVSVKPDLLNAQWAARLREKGVTFTEHCRLTGIHKEAGAITHLDTSGGTLQADRFLFATGAWSSRLSSELGCPIPIEPGKGYSVTMTRPARCPEHPMLFPEHRVGVSPFENGYRLGSMMEFTGFDSSIPASRIQQLRDSAIPYLVDPFTNTVQEEWFGWRPMTWDSLPIIGSVPGLANGYLATGHNMLGLSLATATGKLITEMMHDRDTHIDPAPFSPARFCRR